MTFNERCRAVRLANAVAEFDVPEDRLERARSVVLAMQQNGVDLGALDASGAASPAHFAASIPDIAMLMALHEAGAAMDLPDGNGATPAHIVVLRMVTEPAAENCARFLSCCGVLFNTERQAGVRDSAPASVLDHWPGWWEHWSGWLKRNRAQDGNLKAPRLFLFFEFLKHRRRVAACRSLIKGLDR